MFIQFKLLKFKFKLYNTYHKLPIYFKMSQYFEASIYFLNKKINMLY